MADENEGFFASLPAHVIFRVFSYLDGFTALRSMSVSRKWLEWLRDEALWKLIVESGPPLERSESYLIEQRGWRWLFVAKNVSSSAR